MSNPSIQTTNPLTEQPLKSYPMMSDAEAMDVVETSHAAFLEWRLKSPEERAGVIASIAKELRNSKEEFAQLMTDEVGKLISDSRDEIELWAFAIIPPKTVPKCWPMNCMTSPAAAVW